MRSRPLLLLLAVCAVLPAGCDSSTNKATGERAVDPVELTLANWEQGDSDVGEWAQAVERLSDGAIRIEIRGSWRRGQPDIERATLRDVRAGRVDIGHLPTRAWDTLGVEGFQALDAPLLVDSLELEERVLTGETGAAMLDTVRSAGVEPVALLPGPLRRPVGVSRDLLGPNDYRGALVGLRPSALQAATMRALGAQVVVTPVVGGVGRVDATEADLASLEFEGLEQQARSLTANVVLWPRATTLVMNSAAWRRLTDEQRAVLDDAGRAAVAPVMTRERAWDRGGAKTLCEHDFPIVRAEAHDLAALRRSVAPIYERLERDPDTRALLERIRAVKEDLEPDEVAACGPGREEAAEPSDSPVVGTWQVHVSREEMAAAPRLSGEFVEDNWGGITLTLAADGTFVQRNDRFPGQRIGYGTWTARGDILTFTPGGTVGQGAGELWRYRWTLFRDSLVLRRLTRNAGPTVWIVAPLRRR